MNPDKDNGHDVAELLNRVLRDDLPPETELKMRERLSAFRRAAKSSKTGYRAPRARLRGYAAVLELWLSRPLAHRKKVLAYVSAVMLAAGAVIHLSGYQSVLANSISLLKTKMSLASQIRLADSMECVISMPSNDAHMVTYHIRWVREGRTRVDVEARGGVRETLWISQGQLTIGGSISGSHGSPAAPVTSIPETVRILLSPANMARKLDGDWQAQPGGKQQSPDRVVFTDWQDRGVVEIHFDGRTFLPISLSRKQPPDTDGSGHTATTVRFVWNLQVDPQLMIPRRETGK